MLIFWSPMNHLTYFIWKLLVLITIMSTVLPLKNVFKCLSAPRSPTLAGDDAIL